MNIIPGVVVSHYKIIEKIASGGMGVVYKAKDIHLDRYVAIKFLPSTLVTNEEQKQRFIIEAKSAASIDHPNIGAIYEIDSTESGDLFIAMAYYEGETLKEKIEKGSLPFDAIVDILIQVARGLAKAHENKIIHRDLKPANIIITTDGIVKIIDFGLAKLKSGDRLTRSGTSIGTVAYMSPEQARGEDVDELTDIWSLGVIMYEMLTGQLPFYGDFEAAMLYLIVNEEPKSILSINPTVPLWMVKIVEKALQKNRLNRYQRVKDIINDLEQQKFTAGVKAERKFHKLIDGFGLSKFRERILLVLSFIFIIGIFLFLIRVIFFSAKFSPADMSIAVIPIYNEGSTEFEYLADGITDNIITHLKNVPDLTVVSKATSLLYKNTKLSDSSLSKIFGVRFLFYGWMRVEGIRVKIRCKIQDVKENTEVWNSEINELRSNIFKCIPQINRVVANYFDIDLEKFRDFRMKTNPDNYEIYLRGIYHFRKYQETDNSIAIGCFEEVLLSDSVFTEAMLALAQAYTVGYEYGWVQDFSIVERAEQLCMKILAKDSLNPAVYVVLAKIKKFQGNKSEFVKMLQYALGIDKNFSEALVQLSELYLFEQNEPAKAMVYLKRLQESDPTDWRNNSDVGVAYAQMKNYPEAIYWFHRSIHLNPEFVYSYINLGYAYERLSQYDSAIYYYRTGILKNPSEYQTYENIVDVLLSMGRYVEAESILQQGMKNFESNFKFLYQLGVTNFLMKNLEISKRNFLEGLKLIDSKIKENPKIAIHHIYQGLFHARLGNFKKAITSVENALRIDSTDNLVIIKASGVYALLGRKQEMLYWFERAKTMNPEYDVAYLSTAIDFEKYAKDPDLLFIARRKY